MHYINKFLRKRFDLISLIHFSKIGILTQAHNSYNIFNKASQSEQIFNYNLWGKIP